MNNVDYGTDAAPGAVIIRGRKIEIRPLNLKRYKKLAPICMDVIWAYDQERISMIFNGMISVVALALSSGIISRWRVKRFLKDAPALEIEDAYHKIMDAWGISAPKETK